MGGDVTVCPTSNSIPDPFHFPILTYPAGLNAICVHPSYHRRGAATALVREGTRLAEEQGLECFAACTGTANGNMESVFREARFRVVGSEGVVGGMSVFGGYRGTMRRG